MSRSARHCDAVDEHPISVIVCTRNRAESLAHLLESLSHLEVPVSLDWEVLVVNNASSDATDSVVDQFRRHTPIRYLYNAEPGLSLSRNTALAETIGRHIIWTDDDVTVDQLWLSVYERAFRYWPEFDFFGGPIEAVFEGTPPSWIGDALGIMPEAFTHLDPTAEFVELGISGDFLPFGANMAFRANLLNETRFQPTLGRGPGPILRGSEEIEVMRRLIRHNHTGLWLPPARVKHWVTASRQTVRHLYNHAFGDGFTEEMIDCDENITSNNWVQQQSHLDKSFSRMEQKLRAGSRDNTDWLTEVRETAVRDGRIASHLLTGIYSR